MNTIQIPLSNSEIINSLLTVITLPTATTELIVAACELILQDAAIDTWFLKEVKPSATEELVDHVLETTDAVTDRCKEGCALFVAERITHSDLTSILRSAKKELENLQPHNC